MLKHKKRKLLVSPPLIIAGSFLCLIALGTILLKLPFATTTSVSWVDALFVATSATTVTGLSVFDPGTTLTLFGELVLLFLIQCGGIGTMTFAVAILLLLGKKVGLQNRIYLQESFNQQSIGGIVKLTKLILIFVLTVESVAISLLTLHWIPTYGFSDAFYYSLFHVVSAFNNAGFSLFADNLMGFTSDPIVNLILSSLFIIGGLGFVVVVDIFQKKSFRTWSLHTKMMVIGTIGLNVFAAITLFLLEFNNDSTIGKMSLWDKIFTSYFTAVTPRTAGFNMIDYGQMEDPSLLFTMFLMFIGGGSASTASGIKLTTFMVTLLATFAFFRFQEEPSLFGRSIRKETVIRSLAISTVSLAIVFLFTFALTISEKLPLLPLVFEVFSAFGTVGLTMGITNQLSNIGEVLISIVMFLGRIGPLTLFFILTKPKKVNYRYPYDQVITG
ncbi:TrkH family potassium uptake protein [Psychrobacillus vulpis]|uniref:Ktr system potassium transporter B n=1 Tax=Psychrobacillus vulpis TaxID=2325572 RepID=A0A544TJQ9_9BACI|nr:TrkH family potassium uptake protein [Psychrobacillus vulpis]TQR17694.1 Ktr system potassium transporter B [Psychrobacillus vulpis]